MRHMIVTGVSSGIGLAIARAALEKGYAVQGVGRNSPNQLEGQENWTFTPCDLTDLAAVDGLEFQAGAHTILVNNAGTLGPVAQGENASAEAINGTLFKRGHGRKTGLFYRIGRCTIRYTRLVGLLCLKSGHSHVRRSFGPGVSAGSYTRF